MLSTKTEKPNLPLGCTVDEPLLTAGARRFSLYPIKYPKLFNLYKRQESVLWNDMDLVFEQDIHDWNTKLNDKERKYMSWILALFSNLDGVVLKNLDTFSEDVPHMESNMYFAVQKYIESVHANVYGLLIKHLIPDQKEQLKLLNAIETIPAIKRLGQWAQKWMDPTTSSFAERAIAFACVEGLFFSGAFCGIYWMQNVKKLLPVLSDTNHLIARDERLHTEAYITHYHLLQPQNKLSNKRIIEIVVSAYEIIEEFTGASLPDKLDCMNATLMSQYMKFMVDRILNMIIGETHFDVECPFSFMESISYPEMTNFFEGLEGNYSMAGHKKDMKRESFVKLDDGF